MDKPQGERPPRVTVWPVHLSACEAFERGGDAAAPAAAHATSRAIIWPREGGGGGAESSCRRTASRRPKAFTESSGRRTADFSIWFRPKPDHLLLKAAHNGLDSLTLTRTLTLTLTLYPYP